MKLKDKIKEISGINESLIGQFLEYNMVEYNEYMKNYMKNNKRTKTQTREEMLEKLIFLIENKNNLDFDDWDRILKWVLKIE